MSQLSALLKKNFLLRRRNLIEFFCEILLPVSLLLIVIFLKLAVSKDIVYDETDYVGTVNSSYFDDDIFVKQPFTVLFIIGKRWYSCRAAFCSLLRCKRICYCIHWQKFWQYWNIYLSSKHYFNSIFIDLSK